MLKEKEEGWRPGSERGRRAASRVLTFGEQEEKGAGESRGIEGEDERDQDR